MKSLTSFQSPFYRLYKNAASRGGSKRTCARVLQPHFFKHIFARAPVRRLSGEVEHHAAARGAELDDALLRELVGPFDRVVVEVGAEGVVEAGINGVDALIGVFP
jgi:hypothetical protein